MDTSLDDIRFLADSNHRVVVLEVLADASTSRGDLREATGASSATVGRILRDFDDRGWVRRDGEQYELTRLGRFVAKKFIALHDCMTAAQDLQTLVPWMPLDEMGIDIDNFVGARVTVGIDPIALASRIRAIELDGVHVRSFSALFPEVCVDARYQAVVEGTQTYEVVFTAGFDEGMSAPCAEKFEELLRNDRTTMYVYEGEMPMLAFLDDEGICLLVRDDQQKTIGLIETDDEAVVEYVEAKFEEYREQAVPFTVDDIDAQREEREVQV